MARSKYQNTDPIENVRGFMLYPKINIESINKINEIKTISKVCDIKELLSIINFIGLRKINL